MCCLMQGDQQGTRDKGFRQLLRHGNHEFRIFLNVSSLEHLPILLYYLDTCHMGFKWWCMVTTDCGMSLASFYIESVALGAEAYRQAQVIANKIEEYLKDNKS